MKPWKYQGWVIPPARNGLFVAQMEKVLEVCKRPYDPAYPVVCMDESPKQLISEVRDPRPARPGQPRRVDYEYTRCGMCNIFMGNEPLAGRRFTRITETKTKADWAWFVQQLADAEYKEALKITLVMDNLNTHSPSSFYETFAPAEAKRLWDRFEFVYTPKHGSWLNMAEIELRVLNGQCLNRRIDTIGEVTRQVTAWQQVRNNQKATIDWQFTPEDARIKLKWLYPKINA